MKIKLDKNILVFWAKDKKEEKLTENMRDLFDDNNYKTDRVWNDEVVKTKEPLGMRVFLSK